MTTDGYWWAELADDEDTDPRWPWCPTLQGSGYCLSLPVWFATKAECEQFIRTDVIGRTLLDEEAGR